MIKLSGEALAGEQEFGIDPATVQQISESVKEVYVDRDRKSVV